MAAFKTIFYQGHTGLRFLSIIVSFFVHLYSVFKVLNLGHVKFDIFMLAHCCTCSFQARWFVVSER